MALLRHLLKRESNVNFINGIVERPGFQLVS